MKTTIFCRTWSEDVKWLNYLLRSIAKNCRGFHEVVIAIPEQDKHLLSHLTVERVVPVHDGQPGYLGQMLSKIDASIHCPDADYIWFLDSDCTVTKPVTPDHFFTGGTPRWIITPWEDCMEVFKTWAHVMVQAVGQFPKYEYMRRHEIVVPAWVLGRFREFLTKYHGVDYTSYIMNRPNKEWSEFNCLGLFCHTYYQSEFFWHDTSRCGVPPEIVNQEWSYSGITPEIKAKLEAITQ